MRKLAPFFLKFILFIALFQASSLGYKYYSLEVMKLPQIPEIFFFFASFAAVVSFSLFSKAWRYFFRPLFTFLVLVPLVNKLITFSLAYMGIDLPPFIKANLYYASFSIAGYLSTLGFFLLKQIGLWIIDFFIKKPVGLFYTGLDEIYIFFENLFFNPPENVKNFMIEIDAITGSSEYERGRQFEEIIADTYNRLGFVAETTGTMRDKGTLPASIQKRGGSGEQGVDVLVKIPMPKNHYSGRAEKIMAVQCKLYKNKVDNKAVQEIVAALPLYGADFGVVITNSYFTRPAQELAEANGVELIDRIKLQKLLSKSYLKIAA